MNRRKIAVAALFALPTAAGNWNSAAAQSLLNISYSALSATQAPMWVAQEMKLYAKYGIETRMLYIAGSPANVAALLSGEIQVTQIAPAAALPAIERGGNLTFIAVTTPKVFHYLISRPEIKDVRDLKGKRVGVSRLGSLSDLSATLVLKEHGLESKRDVTILQAGGMSEATAALTRGALDAAILSTPWHVGSEAWAEAVGQLARSGRGLSKHMSCQLERSAEGQERRNQAFYEGLRRSHAYPR